MSVLFELNAEPEDPLVINVTGQQWWWEFDYPTIMGDDGLPIVTASEMVIPAGTAGPPQHHLARRHPLVLDPRS